MGSAKIDRTENTIRKIDSYGLKGDTSLLQKERKFIDTVKSPPKADTEIEQRAAEFVDYFVPEHLEERRQRLHKFILRLRNEDIPMAVQEADPALFRAYKTLRKSCCTEVAAQDALMVLASSHWQPKREKEFQVMMTHQTVARLRNKVLKRLTDGELFIFKHQQGPLDLEVFLVVTSLLQTNAERISESFMQILE